MCKINCFLLAVILIIFLQETHELGTLAVFMWLHHQQHYIWAHTVKPVLPLGQCKINCLKPECVASMTCFITTF